MRSLTKAALVAAVGLSLGAAAQAHHTYVTKYDPARKLTLTGVVSSVRFINPHIFFKIHVANPNGGSSTWKVETESIPKVQAKGLTRKMLVVGSTVTVTGWPARKGSAELGLSSIRLPGGRTVTVRTTPR